MVGGIPAFPVARVWCTRDTEGTAALVLPCPWKMSTTPTISGGCLCGHVRYVGRGLPWSVTHCHCLDCRRAGAAAFVTWATFSLKDFHFTSGTPREFHWAGRVRSFCLECGTPLTFRTFPEAEEVDVTVCSFDNPDVVKPEDHTWVEDALHWVSLSDSLPQHQRTRALP